MLFVKKYTFIFLFLTACTGADGFMAFNVMKETVSDPALPRFDEVIIETDDPLSPYRYFYLGKTTRRDSVERLRRPDKLITSTSGYSYADYCYLTGQIVSVRAPRKVRECDAIRLFFDDYNKLFDYEEVSRNP